MQLISRGIVAAAALVMWVVSPLSSADAPVNGADHFSQAPRPDWVKPVAVDLDKVAGGDQSVRFVLSDTQINLTGKKMQRFVHLAVQPLNQQGLQQVSNISIGFFPAYEDLVIHDISVYRNGRKTSRLDMDDIKLFQQENELQSDMYVEGWTALSILKDVRVNDVVEYSYTVRGSNPVLGGRNFGWEALGWGAPVEHLFVSLLRPQQLDIHFRIKGSDAQIRETSEGDLRRHSVELFDTAAIKSEDGTPSWLSIYPYVEYTEYGNWSGVNQWAAGLYQLDDTLPADFQKVLRSQGDGDKLVQAARITQWIQKNVRYFGIEHGVNSHMPSPPAETLSRRFGDCKDKTVLLVAALHAIGIDAKPALVSTESNLNLDKNLPSPGLFNHVITTFRYGGKRYWVDPTDNSQRGPIEEMSLPDFHWALVVDGKSDRLTEIAPAVPGQRQASTDIEEVFTLGDDRDSAHFNVSTTYTGWKAEQMRSYFGYYSREEVANNFLQYYAKYFPAIESSAPIEVTESDGHNRLVVTEKYFLPKVGKPGKGKNVVKFVASNVADNFSLPATRQRKHPFQLPGEFTIHQKLRIEAKSPDDILWYEKNSGYASENQWFKFTRNVDAEKNTIQVEFNYNSLAKSIPGEDFATYLSDLDQLDSELAYSVWFSSNVGSDARKNRQQRLKDLARNLMNKKGGAQ
ncbi:DUF3857 domain-containing transglutaminase family protein [Microbulbifer hainanensis]|uniref:DUF3857 domain-containing transglutaminase family protein n=1 Tax=Microbulbifer hainanensis TaxID=2735675 RepID=UPI0018660B97|nr:DUF3857 domain-containing protein [Microbulbifer hainanensis]